MVVIISSTRNLKRAVLYNEKKVAKGQAVLLEAGYFLEDSSRLSVDARILRLQRRMELNYRSKASVMLFSLNFARTDQLSAQDMVQITSEFLKKIGFENQPYLLYEHLDTGHRHAHVVSTLIRADGSRINEGNISIHNIKVACRQLEEQFELTKNSMIRTRSKKMPEPEKLLNGKPQTITVIESAVSQVLEKFYFSSFTEFNALLSQFGVKAMTGRIGSRLREHQGVIYGLITAEGAKKSAPIKASRLQPQPTLARLQQFFTVGRQHQQKHLTHLKTALDLRLLSEDSLSLRTLAGALDRLGVKMHARAQQGTIALTYLDNRSRCAFDQSLLGERYSLRQLDARCENSVFNAPGSKKPDVSLNQKEISEKNVSVPSTAKVFHSDKFRDVLLHELFSALPDQSPAPWELRRSAKKKKKRAIHL